MVNKKFTERLIKQITPKVSPIGSIGTESLVLPNHSGDNIKGFVSKTPVKDSDIANKKYVDDNAGGAPEGTAVKSTGEGGATKYLREDGDGTCSWQTPEGGGDVTAAVNLTANTIIQGDDGAKGIKTSTATVAQIASNVTHAALTNEHLDWTGDLGATNIHAGNYTDTNTQLSDAEVGAYGYTKDTEVNWAVSQAPDVIHADNYTDTDTTYVSSDFTHDDLTGFVTNEHLDWTADQGATNIHAGNYTDTDTTDHTSFSNIGTKTHAQLETAIDLNTAKNTNVTTNLSLGAGNATTEVIACSDGTDCTLVEADTNNAGLLGADKWDEIVANSVHTADNTQAHSDYLLNSGSDTTSGTITAAGFTTTGVTLTGDHGTAATDQVVNVCYGTGDPPAANTTTIGALFVKYTA